MTFKNKVISLSSAVAVLTIIYILGMVFSPEKMQEKRSQEKLFNISQMDKVSWLKVSTTDGFAEISKIDGKWMVKSEGNLYPASKYKIDNFLDSIFNMNKNQTVGTDKKHWEKFDLTEDKAKSVTLKNSSGEEILTLFLGKSGPSETGEYIRSTESDESYLTDATFKRYFYKDINYWSRLRILDDDIAGSSITALDITADVDVKGENFKGSVNIVKEESAGKYEWYYAENNNEYQRSKGDTIANNVSSLVADRYTEQKITEPDVVIKLETEKFGKQIIDVQKLDENEFLLNIRGDKYTFVINQYKIHRIISRLD